MDLSIVRIIPFAVTLAALVVAGCERNVTQPETFGSTPNVDVGDNFFEPKVDTVDIGTTVTWTNHGDESHTTTADDGTWDSGSVGVSGTFSRRFDATGMFPYHCAFHGAAGSGMSGTIVVR